MKNKPLISIIIPLYNQGIYLGKCLESVLRQTYTNFRVIIVDDCSTDGSGDVADAIAATDKRITVIHKPVNEHLSAARNTGIKAARTPYIMPLDADDAIAPTMLEKTLERIEDGFGDIIYTDYQEFGESHHQVTMKEYCYDALKRQNCMVCCSLYRKAHWKEVGGYDETMKDGYEDWFFYLKMGAAGHFGYRLAEPLFAYRVKAQSMITESRKKHEKICKQMVDLRPDIWKGLI